MPKKSIESQIYYNKYVNLICKKPANRKYFLLKHVFNNDNTIQYAKVCNNITKY